MPIKRFVRKETPLAILLHSEQDMMARGFTFWTFALQIVMMKDFDVFDDEQVKKAVSRSNLVINLLGQDKETMNFSFEDVHIEAARKVATAAAANGLLERYMHVSCLAASPDHTSRRLRTKVGCRHLSGSLPSSGGQHT